MRRRAGTAAAQTQAIGQTAARRSGPMAGRLGDDADAPYAHASLEIDTAIRRVIFATWEHRSTGVILVARC